MWERATPDLLLRVMPAVTTKLRHPCRPGAADDPTTHAVEHGADTAAECEPDYRFTLANERTFLAWQRTALVGVIPAGLAAAMALCTYLIAVQRQRTLGHRPLPTRITPPRPVYLVGTAVLLLILVTAVAQPTYGHAL
jgi:uncharacterized membrane protein YidH (DUF202 family)